MTKKLPLPASQPRRLKRADLMVEEIKRWIAQQRLQPGDRLPKESELQELFALSKGSTREALKSLEVQGLVRLRSGPNGGATITPASFGRTFQFVQNYLFFQQVDVEAMYQVRRLLEPEVAASATPHIRAGALERLEASIDICSLMPASAQQALDQRNEELRFHDVIAEASPNALLRFNCQIVNELLRSLMVFKGSAPMLHKYGAELGRANATAHRRILAAIRRRKASEVRTLMLAHVNEAEGLVLRMRGAIQRRLVLDSELAEPVTRRSA